MEAILWRRRCVDFAVEVFVELLGAGRFARSRQAGYNDQLDMSSVMEKHEIWSLLSAKRNGRTGMAGSVCGSCGNDEAL